MRLRYRHKNRTVDVDVVAGAIASLAFLVITWLIGVDRVWLSALLGAVVYMALRLMISERDGGAKPYVTTEQRIAQISEIAEQIADGEIRLLLLDVADRSSQLLRLTADHALRADECRSMVRQYLEFAFSAVQLIDPASPNHGSRSRSMAQLKELLTGVRDRFTSLHEKIDAEDDQDLANELSILNRSLHDVDSLWVGINREDGA